MGCRSNWQDLRIPGHFAAPTILIHSDGSIFECKADSSKRLDTIPGCKPKLFSWGGIGEKKPLICDGCKKRVYKITYINGQSLCSDCH